MILNKSGVSIAMFGGTFDPVHKGHVNIMQHVVEYTHYSKVVCVPTSQNPHKKVAPTASAHHRLQMLSLLAEDSPHLEVSDYEIKRQGNSYTIDTICTLKKTYQISERVGLIIGSDLLSSILQWKNVDLLAELTELLIVPRPHYTVSTIDDGIKKLFSYQVLDKMSVYDIESTKIRNNFNEQMLYITPKVLSYIQVHNLYNGGSL